MKQVRDILIVKALEDGKHVVVDDTNLSESNLVRIKQLVHDFNKAHNDDVTVELKEMDTPLEVCIARDSAREKKVGNVPSVPCTANFLAKRNGMRSRTARCRKP